MENETRNEFSIIWRIENFSLWCHATCDQGIMSPIITAENLDKSRFRLDLCCKSEKSVDDKYLFCDLDSYVDVAGDGPIPIECTMEITDGNGKTLQSKSFPKSTESEFYGFEWRNIMKVDELLYKMKNCTEDTLTVRCHIRGESQTRQPRIECDTTTEIGVDRCSFQWEVSNPLILSWRGWLGWSERRIFSFSEKTQIEVTLSAPENDVTINIKRRNKSFQSFVICRMSLIDIKGNERYSHVANHSFRSDDNADWKFPTFFTKTQLEDNDLLVNDAFTLTCSFFAKNGRNIIKVRYRTLPLMNTPCTVDAVSSLQDDLRGMFANKKHADVKLRVDNEIFPAHKSHLAARSSVFSAMFDHEMLESRTGFVDIHDVDGYIMNSFLEFMYTGTVDDMDYEKASKLLTAAEKYQVLSLKERCASFLMTILSKENVCDIMVLADMVGHELLKASSLNYIRSHAGYILRSPQWLKWSEENFKLATEVFCVLSTDIATDK